MNKLRLQERMRINEGFRRQKAGFKLAEGIGFFALFLGGWILSSKVSFVLNLVIKARL